MGGMDRLFEIIDIRINVYTPALNDFIKEDGIFDSSAFKVFSSHIAHSIMQGLEPDDRFQYEVSLVIRAALDSYTTFLLTRFGSDLSLRKKPA